MSSKFFNLLESLRASYWFLPGVMAMAALLLGAGVVYVDVTIGSDWLDALAWYQSNKPAGAREVLSTIAGSSITVAGTVFSVTIVAISFAAGQYGPRLLTNFMSDRGNQVTLGTFVATFLYCLEVLRTIRGGDKGNFVPDLAVLVALALAVASIVVLIYFIHHVPHSIHVNTVIAGIGRKLLADIDNRFPERVGTGAPDDRATLPAGAPLCVAGHATGYIRSVNEQALMSTAERCDIVVRLCRGPGDFVRPGQPLFEIWPSASLDEGAGDALRDSFAVGNSRTPTQDMRFLADELVEIATRALSRGVNDPFTAITCLDWLCAAVAEIGRRASPTAYRLDDEGRLRVIAEPTRFETLVPRIFGTLRPYVARDENAAAHATRLLTELAAGCTCAQQRAVLTDQASRLAASPRV